MEQVSERRDPDLLGSVVRQWRLVAAITFAAAALGLGGSLLMPRVYEAQTSLMVGQFSSGDITINDVKATQSLAATYSDIARRQPVMQAVVDDLHLKTTWRKLVSDVHTKIPRGDPQVIDITVDASSAAQAQRIAGRVAANVIAFAQTQDATSSTFLHDQLSQLQTDIQAITSRLSSLRKQLDASPDDTGLVKQIDDMHTQLTEDQQNYATFRDMAYPASTAQVSVLDAAHAGSGPIRPNVRFNTIIATFVGLVLAVTVAYLLATRRRSDPVGVPTTEPAAEPTPEPAAAEPRDPEPETESDADLEADPESESASESDAEPEAQDEAQDEPVTEAETEAETEGEAQPDREPIAAEPGGSAQPYSTPAPGQRPVRRPKPTRVAPGTPVRMGRRAFPLRRAR